MPIDDAADSLAHATFVQVSDDEGFPGDEATYGGPRRYSAPPLGASVPMGSFPSSHERQRPLTVPWGAWDDNENEGEGECSSVLGCVAESYLDGSA